MNLGLVDTPEKASLAGHRFRREDVDLIFLHVTTYALSVDRAARGAPGQGAGDHPEPRARRRPSTTRRSTRLGDRTRMTGEWLAYCAACPVPEIANVFNRARHPVPPGHRACSTTIPPAGTRSTDWIDAARVAHVMEHNRLGVMGHYYGGMLDIYSDLTQQCADFGGHVEIVEVDELAALRRRGDRGRDPRAGRALPRGLRRPARLPAGGARARGAHLRGPGPAGGRPPPRLAGLLLHGHGQRRRTRTPSARSSSAPRCSPPAASRSPARWRSRTSRP